MPDFSEACRTARKISVARNSFQYALQGRSEDFSAAVLEARSATIRPCSIVLRV